jgi:hypothetical protein
MASGDECIIHAGIYRETITPTANAVSFKAKTHEAPIVTGCELINDWSLNRDGVYKTTAKERVRAVFEDGQHMALARWPNEDGDPFSTTEWATCEAKPISKTGKGEARIQFTDAAWQANQWVGAHFLGYHGGNYFQANQGRIVQSDETGLTLPI